MKKINIGIVGFGGIAKTHVIATQWMNMMDHETLYFPHLRGVCTRQNIKHNFFDYSTADLNDLVQDEEIQIIDVCTPNFLHYQQGLKIIEGKKNIYMEKPIAKDIHEARILAETCDKQALINQAALMYRFYPAVVMARDYIQNNLLGDILHFRFALYHNGYLDENRPISWRLQHHMCGGGALMDLGIHMADLLRFLLGEVESVMGQTNTYFKQRYKDKSLREKIDANVDEWARLHLNLKNGGRGTLEVSRITSDLKEDTLVEIYGTKGNIKITSDNMYYPTIYHHKRGILEAGRLAPMSEFSEMVQKTYPSHKFDLGWHNNGHFTSLQNMLGNVFEEKIRYQETPTLTEAYQSQKIVEMGYISAAQEDRWVKWNEI
ncbi:MAG: Gfo/Idh/MocA family protein [Eubacteriales bacterium]